MRILTAAQARDAERLAITEVGIPATVLMETAGRSVVEALEHVHADALDGRVVVLCGLGNNGGDGFVIARALAERGISVHVAVLGQLSAVSDEARLNLDIARRLSLPVTEIVDTAAWAAYRPVVEGSTLIVDALLGTGVTRPLRGLFEEVVIAINGMAAPIVAVDLPSGLSADSPELLGTTVRATTTVTFTAPKLALSLPPGEASAGEVVVADIGISERLVDRVGGRRVTLLTPEALRRELAPRGHETHKGECGRVTVIGGSRGRTGAAYLAAMGALRSGAGLVTAATPASCQPVLAGMAPEYMTAAMPETADGGVGEGASVVIRGLRHDVIACGPGLGVTDGARALVRALLALSDVFLVLDADALTLVADTPGWLSEHEGLPVVLTPHPGEMARLVGRSVSDVQRQRVEVAAEFATTHGVFVVLKGYRSLVATPDGEVFVNRTGGAGLATGGTGDVLAGVIAAWIAQGRDPRRGCCLGVYLHGLAGDLAQEAEGEIAMTASSVLGCLGRAARTLAGTERRRGSLRWLRT